jgi:hypothetical protein
MANGTMESPIVNMSDIRETLVPCTWMLRSVHAQDVHNHPIEDLFFGHRFGGGKQYIL